MSETHQGHHEPVVISTVLIKMPSEDDFRRVRQIRALQTLLQQVAEIEGGR